ncbi:hypothetical protein DSO57_1030588 [Entomophthora muscae]|uniref:Uncharacterized protein n=1 Tax=Entomophthora muscae TaxID=34485 RepID=A0ACC2SDU9_9FUNG|nr:hypothetical protein DSO57_1030588 [Entomophthora muscae]
MDDSDLEDISDDLSKSLGEGSETSQSQDRSGSLEEVSATNSKAESEGSIPTASSDGAPNSTGGSPNDPADLPTGESHRLASESKASHTKRDRSPEGAQTVARQKVMGSESIDVQGHKRSCSPEFSSDKPQPATTPEVS